MKKQQLREIQIFLINFQGTLVYYLQQKKEVGRGQLGMVSGQG
jgi:hypothetical protein